MKSCCIPWTAVASLGLLASANAGAVALPGDLAISGTVALNTAASYAGVGSALQGGSLALVVGAQSQGTSFSGLTVVTGSNPLGGSFSGLADGIGATLQMAGSVIDDKTEGLVVDLTLQLANSSASNTYLITFAVGLSNTVAAVGADAYAYAGLTVRDAANQVVFFQDRQVDTFFPANNRSDQSLDHSFSVSLAPGESTQFVAVQRQGGGVFATGSYSATLTSFIGVQEVLLTAVPEPASWALMGLGLVAISGVQRRRPPGWRWVD